MPFVFPNPVESCTFSVEPSFPGFDALENWVASQTATHTGFRSEFLSSLIEICAHYEESQRLELQDQRSTISDEMVLPTALVADSFWHQPEYIFRTCDLKDLDISHREC
jgi:hypothetical protein